MPKAPPPTMDTAAEIGPIPTGIWRLNQERSRPLTAKSLTLWITRNEGGELAWVGLETDPGQNTKVTAWSGTYGGPPQIVLNAGIDARVTSKPAEGITTEGEVAGFGKFIEVCRLADGGNRMICHGQVTTASGIITYFEDFDYFSPSPHQPCPTKA